jgi:hypothetical protein
MMGFSILVEKEWLSFGALERFSSLRSVSHTLTSLFLTTSTGHKFYQRPTKKKASASRSANQQCGTFLLWLDAVHQLWELRPQAFVRTILSHIHTLSLCSSFLVAPHSLFAVLSVVRSSLPIIWWC